MDITTAVYQVRKGLFLLLFIVIVGTLGYMFLEEWNFLDSLYMTVITITTTGFAEIKPLSEPGRLFTIFLIISGFSSIAYTGGKLAQIFLEAKYFRSRRNRMKVEQLKDHYIVCGYGRMGKTICEGLSSSNVPFVVLESSQDKIDLLTSRNILCLLGDATSDDTLLKAGILKAKGLVCVIKTDADNVFTALSAKELNPSVYVVARAVDEGTESKLKKAGADRVVKPYDLGGNRMVQLLLRPGVIDFIDDVARNRKLEISLEEIRVSEKSQLANIKLLNSPIRKDLNCIVVTISRETGEFIYNPQSETVLMPGDKLIAIGERSNLTKLEKICSG